MLAELMQECVQRKSKSTPGEKRTWGTLKGSWVAHDTRDQLVDFVHRWSEKAGIAICALVLWLGISLSKFYDWRTC